MLHSHPVVPVVRRLTPDAVRRLAALDGASTPAIEAAIALAPFSLRVQLFSHIPPLIAVEPSETDALSGRPTRIELTDAGRAAVRECAGWVKDYGSTTTAFAHAC